MPIEIVDGTIRVIFVLHLNKAEAPRLASF
jgi:hypothetical protein